MCTFEPTASDDVVRIDAQGLELATLWAKLRLLGCVQGGGFGNINIRTPDRDYLVLHYSDIVHASLLDLRALKHLGVTLDDLGVTRD